MDSDGGPVRSETTTEEYFFHYFYESNENCVHSLVKIIEIAGLMS
jgi:hypothetical protein